MTKTSFNGLPLILLALGAIPSAVRAQVPPVSACAAVRVRPVQATETQAKPDEDLAQCLSALIGEIRNLRLELFEQKLERHEQTANSLERQLANVQAQQRGIDERERSTILELQRLNERLAQPGLNEAERTQLEQLRAMTMTTGPENLAAERSEAAEEEIRLRERLQLEQGRRQELLDAGQQLRGKALPN